MSDQDRNEEIKKALLSIRKRPGSRSVGKIELRDLPLRAVVAVAVRCVSRLRPVFRPCHDDPDRETWLGVLEIAVKVGERFARGEDYSRSKIKEFAEYAEHVSRRAIPGGIIGHAAAYVADSVADAIGGDGPAAVNAAATALSMCRHAVPLSIHEAAAEYDKAIAGHVSDLGPDYMHDLIADDYEKARALGLGSFPELGSPLDPSEAGPLGSLWPSGSPAWFHRS